MTTVIADDRGRVKVAEPGERFDVSREGQGRIIRRKPAAQITPDITCAFNARHTYWGGRQPIPGGNSFENFELRQTFHANQTFIFGISE